MTRELWRSPASIALLPLLLVSGTYLSSATTGADFYRVSQLAQAASAIAIIAPFCAGLAAWEGARLRSARPSGLGPVRTEAAIALRALLPIGLLALVAVAAATAQKLSTGPSLDVEELRLLIVPLAVTAGYSSVAYVIGRRVPAVFAVPGAVVISWLLIVYPIALEPLWIRHLTGYLIGCCDVATVPDTGALLAPVVVAGAMCASAAIVLAPVPAAMRAALAASALAGGVAAGSLMVSGLDSEPTAPRPDSQLVCEGTAPRACVWPENRALLSRVATRGQAIRARLARVGVQTPDTLSEARSTAGRTWFIGVVPETDADSLDAVLIKGLVPRVPPCANGSDPYPGYAADGPLALWLAAIAGVHSESLRGATEAGERREALAVLRRPRGEQLDWYRTNVRAVAACGVMPRLLTSR